MAGSISQLPNGKFYVSWYDKKLRKTHKIYKYKGMYLYDRRMAEKLLHAMQNDVENNCFRIEKYTLGETDIIPYMWEWLEAIAPTVSPGTYDSYKSSIKNHLEPFFRKVPISMHEIQYDTLVKLMNSIDRCGRGKHKTVQCLHVCLRFAKRSGRIQSMPEFPERSMYRIQDEPIQWLPSDRQEKVLNAIPVEHQPIFWWLKYHLRRPSEACALQKEDFDGSQFVVRNGFSSYQYVERTKTGDIHLVPMHSGFAPYLAIEAEKQKTMERISPFFFVNPRGRTDGKHYAIAFLEKLWDTACKKVGESINLYAGLKHSTASQMKNEWGYTDSEIQMAGDWSDIQSVRRYAKTEVSARKSLLEGKKVIQLKKEEHGHK